MARLLMRERSAGKRYVAGCFFQELVKENMGFTNAEKANKGRAKDAINGRWPKYLTPGFFHAPFGIIGNMLRRTIHFHK